MALPKRIFFIQEIQKQLLIQSITADNGSECLRLSEAMDALFIMPILIHHLNAEARKSVIL